MALALAFVLAVTRLSLRRPASKPDSEAAGNSAADKPAETDKTDKPAAQADGNEAPREPPDSGEG